MLAQAIERKLLHFDMTQFSASNLASTSLFGAAKGYVGSTSYGKLSFGRPADIDDAGAIRPDDERRRRCARGSEPALCQRSR